MTASELKRLAAEVARKHGLHLMTIRHSVGFVPVEATSFRLVVAAPHRAQALAAMSEFIDRMKQEVPLWKVPLFAD
jgi:molybdopterin synthase catalytic subunit